MSILGGPKKKEEKNPPVVYISILELIGVKPSDRNRDPGAHTSHGNCWLRFLFSFLSGTRSHTRSIIILYSRVYIYIYILVFYPILFMYLLTPPQQRVAFTRIKHGLFIIYNVYFIIHE